MKWPGKKSAVFSQNTKINPFRMFMVILTICILSVSMTLYGQNNEITDEKITDAIETDLWIDSKVDMNTIDVETEDGIVTFTGTADNLLEKERAAKIAETIAGVKAVVNLIKVRPYEQRTDEDLKEEVEKALSRDPATEPYEVKVEVKNGVVSLTGKVDSWQEKRLAGTVVKRVKGVQEVENKVDFVFDTNRADDEIRNEIESVLAYDVRVDDNLIDVEVEDGEVILSGTVGSLAEKNQAIRDSWVSGVERVRADDLKIKWWTRDEMRRIGYSEQQTDQDIKRAVETAFVYDPRISSFDPEINVNEGIVTLKGVVGNLQAKKAAGEDAKNVVGVWRVKNHIKVQPSILPMDAELKDMVGQALVNDPYINRSDVHIRVSYGMVYLSGKVNTSFEKFHAELVAQRVRGVTSVVNNLDYDYKWAWKSDRKIKDEIKDQFQWSLFVDGSDIKVSVENGVVTLEGEVYNWSEYNAAEKNAFEAGAKDVINNLDVIYPLSGPYNQYPYWVNPFYK